MKKIKDNRYALLIMVNVVFGIAILFLLYANFSIKQQSPSNASTAAPQSPANDSSTSDDLLTSLIVNGNFEQGALGWSNPKAIQKEANGNHYIINNYNWLIKQDLNLLVNKTYEISASIKRGTATGPARIVITFLDVNGKRLNKYYDINYTNQGAGWEEIPNQLITVPENTSKARIYLLCKDKKGYYCFDNIRLAGAAAPAN
ncbi:hypothetical protein [Desulfotruncus arcticus]|nr:hypothetical protein [Desulfotruncus arcticus]